MADIKAGDIVQLKSGGPHMTVRKVEQWDGGPRAWCQWFADHNKKTEDVFPLTSLDLVE